MTTTTIVVATRNRAGPLMECLTSISGQSLLPNSVVVVDASDDRLTLPMIRDCVASLPFGITYLRADSRSAARQRNQGARNMTTDLVLFLDDDVVLEPDFLAEIVKVFESDDSNTIGGVCGTIVNEPFSPPSRLNRWILRLCVGPVNGSYAGRLVGPAAHFTHPYNPTVVEPVDWLPAGCAAYRTAIFQKFQFAESFEEYSFAEDVHLSARIAKEYRLFVTGRARVFHKGLGGASHRDWPALGEMMISNRHEIMTRVLEKRSVVDYVRLVLLEIVYGFAAGMWNNGSIGNGRRTALITWGRLRGLIKILMGTTTHDNFRRVSPQPSKPESNKTFLRLIIL